MAEERVLWTKTDSATFEVDYGAHRKSVYKSFSPDDIARAYRLVSGEDSSTHVENPLQKDSQASLFWREYNLLKAFQGSGYVPQLVGGPDRKHLRINMSYIEYRTFQDAFTGMGEEEIISATQEIVQFLGRFQEYVHPNLQRILQVANEGRDRLTRRSFRDEHQSLEKHLVNIAFTYGAHFRRRTSSEDLDTLSHDYQARSSAVLSFFKDRRLNLTKKAGYLVDHERNAVGEAKVFSHGDWRPQNIFGVEDEGRFVGQAVCDFDKVQLHGRAPVYDLASGIFHPYLFPLTADKMQFAVDTAKDFLRGQGHLGEELDNQVALFVGESLLLLLRDFAVKTIMPYSSIQRFAPRQQTESTDKDHYLITTSLAGLEFLLSEVQQGDVFEMAVQPSKKHRDYVVGQARVISKILRTSGVQSKRLLENLSRGTNDS
ncbi:phosphotransferase [Candidatus Woesearchaeota archaeon]|nr:phosphotransferase [Candidatus Woesearchaeota archaeon]